MITSMTGFGLADRKNKNFSIEINIKSTNNRFFDLNIRIPSTINSLEKIIHDKCKEYFIRGSIQLFCKIKLNDLKMRGYFESSSIVRSRKKIRNHRLKYR